MEWYLVLLIIVGGLIVLMLTGMPIAFCFMLIDLVGVYIFFGGQAGFDQFVLSILNSVSTFSLVPVALFMLMGQLVFQSGLGFRMLEVLDKWLGQLPGRLSLLAVGGGTIFSVMSGSSLASVALLGSVLVPEMEKHGYKKPMSLGPILGSGGLAMIIPPSAMAVLLGALASINVGRLLIAGIIPGLIIAFLYSSYVIIRCLVQPSLAPAYSIEHTPLSEKLLLTAKYVLPVGLIIFLVLGVIFLGIATPSEAAATGTVGTFILAVAYRRMNLNVLKNAFIGSLNITVMIFTIIAGAAAFGQILSLSGASRGFVQWVATLPLSPILLVIAMQFVALVLGTFMSIVPVMMITLPIFMPIVLRLGFDPVWFGLIMLINLEMSTTTPPFGMLLYVMKGSAPQGTTMKDVIFGALPFLFCDLVAIIIFMFFPSVVLWLPSIMV
jgi:tripartite ATP-independent transporter DctM subunit